MGLVTHIEIDAIDAAYPVTIKSGANTTVEFAGTVGGTATAGTVTIEASGIGSQVFNTVTGISPINLASQEPQNIVGTPADRLELTLAGFTGTANKLKFTATTWD